VSASAAITERLDAKAREAKLLREVFETFAKTVAIGARKVGCRNEIHHLGANLVCDGSLVVFARGDEGVNLAPRW
jgi:hypothetical protein